MRITFTKYINISRLRRIMRVFIVIPAFNEEQALGTTLRGLKKEGYRNIIVVDDGSTDKTLSLAKKEGIIVLKHRINRGLGGALHTGIEAALRMDADAIVTFDADGQHDPKDVKRMIEPLRRGKADFVVGTRLKDPEGMPWMRRMGNWFFNVITWMLFGVWTTDSQSGLRAFTRSAAEKIELRTNRMEVSSEFIREVGKKKLTYAEVPIKAIYTDYSLRKGQSSLNGIRILRKLLWRKFVS